MYGRRYQRKRGFHRTLVLLLTLVMLAGVCFPGLRASAEGETADVVVKAGEKAEYSVSGEIGEIFVSPQDGGLVCNKEDGKIVVDATSASPGTYKVAYVSGSDSDFGIEVTFTVLVTSAVEPENNTEQELENLADEDEDTKDGETIGESTETFDSADKEEDSKDNGTGNVPGDETKNKQEETEQSWYNQLMACETLESMLDLLDGQEEPSTLLTDAELEEFEKYLNEKLENSEWTEDRAGEKVTSIIAILEDSESETVAYAGPGGSSSQSTQNYVVYVYVCYEYGGTRLISDECLELLGLHTADQYGYIPVGQITNIDSLINAKGGLNNISASVSLLTSADDWNTLLSALGNLDTSTLTSSDNSHVTGEDFTANKNNNVYQYINQARQDTNQEGSSGKSQLSLQYKGYETTSKYSCGFSNEGDYYAVFHLDLFFNTKKITFVTGNNGISSGSLPDDTTVDTRAYITGSVIKEPKDFSKQIPDGYYWDGKYYKDADFTEEWEGIGTPLNDDTTVYIKLIEYEKCRVEYNVAQGVGTVSVSGETFYVTGTGTPKSPSGSTATPGTDYVFEGWYSDENCTTKVSGDAQFVPTAPAGGWQENETYTYYAKFVPATTDVTISKTVTGNMGDYSKSFEFTYKVGIDGTQSTFSLAHDGSTVLSNLSIGQTLYIKEEYGTYTPTVTYTVDGMSTTVSAVDDWYAIPIQAGTTVSVTNNKTATIDTGIFTDTAPYIILFSVAAVGAAVLLTKKRRYQV